MTEARAWVHQQLVEQLPDSYTVHPYAPQLDGVQGATILLRLSTITPSVVTGTRSYGFSVLAVAPVADVDLATSEEVDQLAEDVLHALDKAAQLTWSSAERVAVDDTWAGWEIKAAATLTLTDPDTTTTP